MSTHLDVVAESNLKQTEDDDRTEDAIGIAPIFAGFAMKVQRGQLFVSRAGDNVTSAPFCKEFDHPRHVPCAALQRVLARGTRFGPVSNIIVCDSAGLKAIEVQVFSTFDASESVRFRNGRGLHQFAHQKLDKELEQDEEVVPDIVPESLPSQLPGRSRKQPFASPPQNDTRLTDRKTKDSPSLLKSDAGTRVFTDIVTRHAFFFCKNLTEFDVHPPCTPIRTRRGRGCVLARCHATLEEEQLRACSQQHFATVVRLVESECESCQV